MSFTLTLFGQTTPPHSPSWDLLGWELLGSLLFGLVGIGLLLLGYFVFDLITRRIDVQAELNKGNTAVAIVVGALLLAIAYIAAHVVV